MLQQSNIDRLAKILIRAEFDRADRIRNLPLPGDHDGRYFDSSLAYLAQDRETVLARQAQVEKHDVGTVRRNQIKRADAIFCDAYLEAPRCDQLSPRLSCGQIVLDHEYPFRRHSSDTRSVCSRFFDRHGQYTSVPPGASLNFCSAYL